MKNNKRRMNLLSFPNNIIDNSSSHTVDDLSSFKISNDIPKQTIKHHKPHSSIGPRLLIKRKEKYSQQPLYLSISNSSPKKSFEIASYPNTIFHTAKNHKTKSYIINTNKKKKMIPFPHINHRKELSESSGLLVFHNTYIKEAIDKEKMDKLWEKAYIGDSKVDLVQIRNPSLNMRSSSSKKKKLVFKTNNIKDLNLYREFENIFYKYK